MNYLNQHNYPNVKLGDTSVSVATDGCLVTCLAMLLNTTPDVVVARMKAVGGFQGALIVWGAIEKAFPGVTVKLGWTYNNDDVKANVPCIVRVNGAPIGGYMHFVNYLGNQQIADPWTGTVRSTSAYQVLEGTAGPVYCIISGKWEQPQAGTVVDPETFTRLVDKSTKYDKFVAAGYSSVDDVTTKIKTLQDQLNQETTLLGKIKALFT